MFLLAGATPAEFGTPALRDETLERFEPLRLEPGDVVEMPCVDYAIGREARERGAWVIYGCIHGTLYPEEASERGAAHAAVKGDGDIVWPQALRDCATVHRERYTRADGSTRRDLSPPGWDLLPENKYTWESVQTVRGCAKHCSFCSVWRTDGQRPRQRTADTIVEEIVQLRRKGFRFIALADDNFYPVSLTDIAQAKRQGNAGEVRRLESIRAKRFELMARLAEAPA